MNRALRVLQVLPRSSGGIGRHVTRLLEEFAACNGMVVDVAGPSMTVALPKPLLPLDIPDGAFGRHLRAAEQLKRILEEGHYDLIHAHGLRAGLHAAAASRRHSVPVVLTVHNLVRPEIAGSIGARVLARAEPLAVRAAARTFAPSEEIARHLQRAAPSAAGRIEVLYARAAPPKVTRSREAVRAELHLNDTELLVVTASRLAPQKALHVMLAALPRLPPRVVLAVAGEGPLRARLEQRARELRISSRLRFLGWRPDVADVIAAADVFCLSSIWEAVALAAQEAVLLSTPVVSTDAGGMRELITDRVSGRLVSVGDPAALAGALHDVLFGTDAADYAAAARGAYLERFSDERMMQRLRDTYQELGRADQR